MTLNDLYRKTLERMQVAADGEPAQPSDLALVAEKYVDIFEMLQSRELADWDSQTDIPADVGLALTLMLAAYSADDFFVPEPRKSQLKAEGLLDGPVMSTAERMLRKRRAGSYISTTVKTEYF